MMGTRFVVDCGLGGAVFVAGAEIHSVPSLTKVFRCVLVSHLLVPLLSELLR